MPEDRVLVALSDLFSACSLPCMSVYLQLFLFLQN